MMHEVIPPAALEQHTAVLGKTGAGKTTTTKLAVEQIVATGGRVCVLDPIKSDWWGLISSADGTAPGLPFVILGGPHGHIPLDDSTGAAVAELVASGAIPLVIIDMADFRPGGGSKFFAEFAPFLLRKMKGVLHLVIEEAHLFAPKERSGVGGMESMAIHWAKTIATAGRSKGIRLLLTTQRTQSLHNALLGSCDTLIAHRLTAPADQLPVVNWLKANVHFDVASQVASSLPSLPTGTAWVCSGEAKVFEKIAFPRISTFDNSATPKHNQEVKAVATSAPNLEQLRATLGAAIATALDNDPVALKARIAELERTKAGAKNNPNHNEALRKAREQGVAEGAASRDVDVAAAGREAYARGRNDAARDFMHLFKDFILVNHEAGGDIPAIEVPAPVKVAVIDERRNGELDAALQEFHTKGGKPWAEVKAELEADAPAPGAPLGGFTGPQHKILRALSVWIRLGRMTPTKIMVAALAGYSPSSGGFRNLLGQLRAAGVITYPSASQIQLQIAPVDTGDAFGALWAALSNPQRKILDALTIELSKTALAERTEYSPTSGGFRNLLGQLRSRGLIYYPEGGQVARTPWLKDVMAESQRTT